MVARSLGIRKFFGSSLELFHIFGAKILYKFEDIFAILKSGIVDQGDNNVPFWTGAILGQANVETWPLVLSMRCQYLSNCDHSCKAVWRPKKLNHFQKLRKTIIEQPRRQRSANLWLCQATPCWWGDVTTRSQHEVPIFVEWRPFLQGSLTTILHPIVPHYTLKCGTFQKIRMSYGTDLQYGIFGPKRPHFSSNVAFPYFKN